MSTQAKKNQQVKHRSMLNVAMRRLVKNKMAMIGLAVMLAIIPVSYTHLTRVAAILPKLSGMSGVLHLEDFTDDTQNIIFDQD